MSFVGAPWHAKTVRIIEAGRCRKRTALTNIHRLATMRDVVCTDMNVVVVFAHPSNDSFSFAIYERALTALNNAGHVVSAFPLYEEHFVAAMSRDEWKAYGSDRAILDPQVARYATAVQKADALVFIYPTWWSGLPSIVKGWCDRVLVSGVAFTFNDAGKVKPSLRNVKHIVGISTYGSPRTYIRLINDNGRRTIMRALRLCTGFKTRTTWLGLYAISTTTAEEREQFLVRVETTLVKLK